MRSSRITARAITALMAFVAFSACTQVDAPTGAASPRLNSSPRGDVSASADPVIVAAGDIVCGNGTPAGTPCKHAQTAALIGTINPDAVLLLGDNQYEDGTYAEYQALYNPTWGQYKSITYPSVGNHEYQTANASGYYDYFNGVGVQVGRAGDRAKGYYSYDMGAWHLIALNSNCGNVGGCGVGSAQEVWLKADLAAHTNSCVLAYWHAPLFSSGAHGNDASTQALWQALYNAKADLVLTGHDHNYERFARQTATGVLDATNGIQEFVVGTGGKEQRAMGTTKANSLLRSNTSFGVLKVTLHPTSYDWQFVATSGGTLADAGTSNCVGLPAQNTPPTASISAPANNSSFVQGASVTFTGSGNDAQDGALSGAALTWASNLDGAIGTGTTFNKSNLSVGTHTITLTSHDSQGLTGTATITVTITTTPPVNQPPVASFTVVCGTLSPRTCSVDASASTDDHGIVSYGWVWGGGKSKTVTTPTTTSTYAADGVYTIILTVTDAGGLTGTTSHQVTVGSPPPNQPPTAAISSPANNASFVQGASVSFAGTGADPEDGALSGASLVWTSSINGQIGTGTSFSTTTLSVGTHTITLKATDSQGAFGTATRTITITAPVNQAPTASITAPANNASFVQGASVSFAGTGTDPEQGALSGASLVWTSSINGQIGTGTSFSTTTLSVGTHTITLKATDAQGAFGTATRTITITAPVNQAPTPTITAPANNASFVQGASVSFSGTGNDPEDGALSGASLVWTSSINGQIGTGTSFSTTTLSVGAHTISLKATDSQGANNTTSITVNITATPPVNQPPVASFTWTCTGQAFPHQCSLDGSASTDDHGIVNWIWDWGNGRPIETKTGPTAKNTWATAPGTFQVTLTVKDASGLTSSVTKAVVVP